MIFDASGSRSAARGAFAPHTLGLRSGGTETLAPSLNMQRSSDESLTGAVMLLLGCALCAWVFALWFAMQRNSTRDYTYRVTAIIPGQLDDHPYGVLVEGGHPGFSFRRPPGLTVGDEIVARYDRAGQYVGWSHDGRFTPRLDQPSKVVFFLPLGVAICLTWVTAYVARGERPRDRALAGGAES